ncbi:JmjC domain containing protein [Plasmodium vivax]|uniref:JmjC domain containing protein n=2 Tax=Plasmodium vivax TaxID=5855 RepID=A0A1G4HK70_PLAVI|nr:JmjC domain containing protein [Plasmodium vivax]
MTPFLHSPINTLTLVDKSKKKKKKKIAPKNELEISHDLVNIAMDLYDKNTRKRKRNSKLIISSRNEEDDVDLTEKNKKNKLIISDVDCENVPCEQDDVQVKKECDAKNKCALKGQRSEGDNDQVEEIITLDGDDCNYKLEEEEKQQMWKNEQAANSPIPTVEIKLEHTQEIIKKCDDSCNRNNMPGKNKMIKLQSGKLTKSENKNNRVMKGRKKKKKNSADHHSNNSIYKNIEEIPVIHTTMEELSNPILFFEKYNSIGLKYGAMRVKPPNFFEPQFNSYYLNMKFNIRKQKINELKHGKEFDHPEEYWSLYEVYKYNQMLEKMYLPKEKASLENIEKKYWEIINKGKEQVVSVYGADLPVSKNHPTCLFHNNLKRLEDSGRNDSSSDISTANGSRCSSVKSGTIESSCESSSDLLKRGEEGGEGLLRAGECKEEMCEDPTSANVSSGVDKQNDDMSLSLLPSPSLPPGNSANEGNSDCSNGHYCNGHCCNGHNCNGHCCNGHYCNGHCPDDHCSNDDRISDDCTLDSANVDYSSDRANAHRGSDHANNEGVVSEREQGIIDVINISDPENGTMEESLVDNRGHAINKSDEGTYFGGDRKKDHSDHLRGSINGIDADRRRTPSCAGGINEIASTEGGMGQSASDKYDRSKGTSSGEVKICHTSSETHVGDLPPDSMFIKQRERYYSEINSVIKNINENLNIKSLPFIKGSMLRNVDISIEGVNIPWLYVGTLFSSFCWHTEDNYFASINYQHWGNPKIWYVIPPLYSDKVEDVIYEYLKENSYQEDVLMERGNRKMKKKERRNLFNNSDLKKKLKEESSIVQNIATEQRLKNMRISKNNPNLTSTNGIATGSTSCTNDVIMASTSATANTRLLSNSHSNSSSTSTSTTMSTSHNNNTLADNLLFIDVDINNADLIYRKSYLNYKIVDRKQINFKKENNKNKIYKLTIQVPIEVFLKNKIPVYKNIQRKNEFIFLWPKTFHGGFNSGYNCNEACNIAPTFWLFYGLQSYYNYKYFRNTCISIHFILFSNLLHYQEYTFSQLKHIIYSLRYILTDEYKFFRESKTLFIEFTLNRDALLNNKLMNYSGHLSLDLNKMYANFECQKNKHFFFQNIKSKLEFFYKDCDACNSPTFNSSIICPHSNDILCIHCSEEHSCNCKFKVALKRYTLLEMMKILTLLIHYANKIKANDEKEVQFDDIPDYNSLKIFEDKNSVKLYNLIRETKRTDLEKRSRTTNYIDLENYCFEKLNNIGKEKNKREKTKNEKCIVLEDYYTSSNHFKTKLTLKYFLLTYEEEMEDNPLKILPKLII